MDTSPLRHRPDALLLDFGGVVFQTRKRPEGRTEAAHHLHRVLARAGHHVDPDLLRGSLDAGLAALKDWKNAAGRRRTPAELDHRTIWTDFLASDLDDRAREILAGSAAELLADMSPLISEHEVRPGVRELLAAAGTLGVRAGIVSNAHSGRSHRRILREAGLEDRFGVQVYSDEVGIRKPHPEMIALAARALGTVPERCWYVGDTQDRDVVAGRRAGTGAVILTRHHHTDTPPYPVRERADAVFDTPEGLVVPLLHSFPAEPGAGPDPEAGPASAPGPASGAEAGGTAGGSGSAQPVPEPRTVPEPPRVPRPRRAPAALLLDQGGVIARSTATPDAQRDFARSLAVRLDRAGYAATTDTVLALVLSGRDRYRAWKAAHPEDGPIPEITPRRFWFDMVGHGLPPRARAFLLAESAELTLEYARSKSHATLRSGVREVLEFCAGNGVPVGIVSNTVCGRAVREELDRFDVLHLVGAHVYSDELGRRKPDPATVRAATTALGVSAADCWFVGDKPWRDTAAAHRAGVGVSVIVRGGSASDEQIDAALTGPADLRPTHVIDETGDLLGLWTDTPAPLTDSEPVPSTP
ncbi:HAD family hydrolase [Nocardiopsis ganjiahuensis]|uniref:HAD family hydrolase n=1 Tax=Nocardiopsis ganjiahuensis TaxID=239984 RepID=UPI00034AFE26|nr:HAD-IA family hydrolase [Nocardiopsis ganjiahuensis]